MAEQTQEQTQELSEQIEESLTNRRDDSNVYIASQWQLMWWRLRRHKLAMASLIVLAGFYFISAFGMWLSVLAIIFWFIKALSETNSKTKEF